MVTPTHNFSPSSRVPFLAIFFSLSKMNSPEISSFYQIAICLHSSFVYSASSFPFNFSFHLVLSFPKPAESTNVTITHKQQQQQQHGHFLTQQSFKIQAEFLLILEPAFTLGKTYYQLIPPFSSSSFLHLGCPDFSH
jgi:hypothetical protein